MERQAVYQGQLLTLARQLPWRDFCWSLVQQELGWQPRLPVLQGAAWLEAMGRIRAALQSDSSREQAVQALCGWGLDPADYLLDWVRLRGIVPGAEQLPEAAPAYYAHRDTWYANPQCQINLWMPLHDVTAQDSFAFFSQHFQVAVANDSSEFDYQEFLGGGGFQSHTPQKRRHYPRLLESLAEPAQAVELEAGQVLAFSAAQLHQTLPNRTERIRFSVDLRLVHRGDLAAGLGAPNFDNASRGSAWLDYPW